MTPLLMLAQFTPSFPPGSLAPSFAPPHLIFALAPALGGGPVGLVGFWFAVRVHAPPRILPRRAAAFPSPVPLSRFLHSSPVCFSLMQPVVLVFLNRALRPRNTECPPFTGRVGAIETASVVLFFALVSFARRRFFFPPPVSWLSLLPPPPLFPPMTRVKCRWPLFSPPISPTLSAACIARRGVSRPR